MNALAPLPPVDLLADAIGIARQYLDREHSLPKRAKIFWTAVAVARHLAASDVIHDEFFQLAVDCGLLAEFERAPPYAAGETIEHLIRWGLLDQDPFGSP
jgi:hypothetical protein